MQGAAMIQGLKPHTALIASATKPGLYWSLATSNAATMNTTGAALPALTAAGSPAFSSGSLALDDTSNYTFDTADNEALWSVFNFQEGVLMLWARPSVSATASGQDHMIAVHTGAGPQLRFSMSAASGRRPDIWLAFDGETSATQYAGDSTGLTADTEGNVCIVVDNRVGQKTIYRWVNGVSVASASIAGKGAFTYNSGVTQRVRIGSDSATVAASFFKGTLRRLGAVNFGTTMPANISDIVQSLHQHNGSPTRELLVAMQ